MVARKSRLMVPLSYATVLSRNRLPNAGILQKAIFATVKSEFGKRHNSMNILLTVYNIVTTTISFGVMIFYLRFVSELLTVRGESS